MTGRILGQDMHTEGRSPTSGSLSGPAASMVRGKASLLRVRLLRFPAFELVVDGEVRAKLARPGWWRIFFGRGQLIELADGTRWRLRAVGMAGAICPVIVDSEVRKVAQAAPHHGGYGINGRDWAYVLFAAHSRRFARANQWILREHEENVATVSRTPWEINLTTPIPLGAAILALTLMRYAIPGESGMGVPRFRWGAF